MDAVGNQVIAVRALLRLPEAVGYYSGDVDTTYGKGPYLTITDLEEPLLSAFMAPVWVGPSPDGRCLERALDRPGEMGHSRCSSGGVEA